MNFTQENRMYIDEIYSQFQNLEIENFIEVDLEKIGGEAKNWKLPEYFIDKFSAFKIKIESIESVKDGDAKKWICTMKKVGDRDGETGTSFISEVNY